MSYAFHDIKHIVELYLDDLPTHSQWREDHPSHLRDIFLRCRHYNIWLNPHKCDFCVETGHLLGFVVSKDGIQVDPLKIATILALPAPTNLLELQSFQGKGNFLYHFVCNFVEKMHGDMHLLKKNTPFFWDDQAQCAFDNIKHALTHSLVIHPPDYSKEFPLYITTSTTTIAMVLVQENPNGQEHVIYYVSKNLMDSKTQYSCMEKLALAMAIDVQKLCHYIFLRTTTVLAD